MSKLDEKLSNLFHLHERVSVDDGGGKQPAVGHQLQQRNGVSSALERLVTLTHKYFGNLPRLGPKETCLGLSNGWVHISWFCPTAGCIFLVPSLNVM